MQRITTALVAMGVLAGLAPTAQAIPTPYRHKPDAVKWAKAATAQPYRHLPPARAR